MSNSPRRIQVELNSTSTENEFVIKRIQTNNGWANPSKQSDEFAWANSSWAKTKASSSSRNNEFEIKRIRKITKKRLYEFKIKRSRYKRKLDKREKRKKKNTGCKTGECKNHQLKLSKREKREKKNKRGCKTSEIKQDENPENC